MQTSPVRPELAPLRLPSVTELLAAPQPAAADGQRGQTDAVPCSGFRTSATDKDARPQPSCLLPHVAQLGTTVLQTYTPYTSPWSIYAGFGPPPIPFGAGASSAWSPGLIDRPSATDASSTTGRLGSTSHRSPSFTASFHPYSRTPSSAFERPLSPVSPPVHATFATRPPPAPRAPQGLLPPLAPMPDGGTGAEPGQQLLPRSNGRFPSLASMPTPSVLGLTSHRIEQQQQAARRLHAQHGSASGEYWLACPPAPTSPSALGLQFVTPPPTADSSPTATEPSPHGWVEADVRWSSEILLGLATGGSARPSGPSECEDIDDDDDDDNDYSLSESESAADEPNDDVDDVYETGGIACDMQEPVSPERPTLLSPVSITPPAKKSSQAHRRAGHKRRRSTASTSSTTSADLAGPSAGNRKRASSKATATCTAGQRHSRPYGCEFCSERFLRKNDYNRHKRIHTGERPYSCPTCKLGFMRNDALLRHLAHSASCAAQAPSRDEFVFGIGAPKRRKSVSSAPTTSRRG